MNIKFSIIFWVLVIIIVSSFGFGAFYFYQYYTAKDADLSLKAPESIYLGVPFEIEANFKNNSNSKIENVKLSIILPDGISETSPENKDDKRVFENNIGSLEQGDNFTKKISLLGYKGEQSIKKFEAIVSYSPPGLGPKARLEKKKSIEITIKESGIKLDLIAPQKVLNSEDFEIDINYQNIGGTDFSDVQIELYYPTFFNFKKTTATSTNNFSIWKIDKLIKGESAKSFSIYGNVVGSELSFFEIKGVLSINYNGRKYVINEKTANLNIASSPLFIGIILNNEPGHVTSIDKSLRYSISYKNNTDVGLSDVIIKAQLVGEMFDIKSLRTSAFFNSKDNTIMWNTANTPQLRTLNPGDSGTVDFEIKTLTDYPIKRLSDKNFTLKVKGEISSPTVPYYVAADRTIGVTSIENKISGNIKIDAKALFKDSSSGMTNNGSLPPRVNQPTNYTIHWIIANYATDVSNVKVNAFLQSGVRLTGAIKVNNTTSTPIYNERNQEIAWSINEIPATKGIIGSPVEVIFQIEAIPNITQLNEEMPLLSDTKITAIDKFTNINLSASYNNLTSILRDDPTTTYQQWIVQP